MNNFKFTNEQKKDLFKQALKQNTVSEVMVTVLQDAKENETYIKKTYGKTKLEFVKYVKDAEQKLLLMSIQTLVMYNIINTIPYIKKGYPYIINELLRQMAAYKNRQEGIKEVKAEEIEEAEKEIKNVEVKKVRETTAKQDKNKVKSNIIKGVFQNGKGAKKTND